MTTLVNNRITIGRPEPTGWRAKLEKFDHSLDQTSAGQAVLRFGNQTNYSQSERRSGRTVDKTTKHKADYVAGKDPL